MSDRQQAKRKKKEWRRPSAVQIHNIAIQYRYSILQYHVCTGTGCTYSSSMLCMLYVPGTRVLEYVCIHLNAYSSMYLSTIAMHITTIAGVHLDCMESMGIMNDGLHELPRKRLGIVHFVFLAPVLRTRGPVLRTRGPVLRTRGPVLVPVGNTSSHADDWVGAVHMSTPA